MLNAGDGDRVGHGIQDGMAGLGEVRGTFLARIASLAQPSQMSNAARHGLTVAFPFV